MTAASPDPTPLTLTQETGNQRLAEELIVTYDNTDDDEHNAIRAVARAYLRAAATITTLKASLDTSTAQLAARKAEIKLAYEELDKDSATITTLRASLGEAEKRAGAELGDITQHSRSCVAVNPQRESACSCSLKWRQRVAASSRREAVLREALSLILPMAKGYVADHPEASEHLDSFLQKANASLSTTPATRTLGRTPE